MRPAVPAILPASGPAPLVHPCCLWILLAQPDQRLLDQARPRFKAGDDPVLLRRTTDGLVGPHDGEHRPEVFAAIGADQFDRVFLERPTFGPFESRIEATHDNALHEIGRYDDIVSVQERRRCSAIAQTLFVSSELAYGNHSFS